MLVFVEMKFFGTLFKFCTGKIPTPNIFVKVNLGIQYYVQDVEAVEIL